MTRKISDWTADRVCFNRKTQITLEWSILRFILQIQNFHPVDHVHPVSFLSYSSCFSWLQNCWGWQSVNGYALLSKNFLFSVPQCLRGKFLYWIQPQNCLMYRISMESKACRLFNKLLFQPLSHIEINSIRARFCIELLTVLLLHSWRSMSGLSITNVSYLVFNYEFRLLCSQ